MLNLLFIGAGGIGGYYAARLLRAGHQVTLTARGEHLAALQRNGLCVHYQGNIWRHQVTALSHSDLIARHQAGDFTAIVLTLKSSATAAVMQELADWLRAAEVPVMSLQNGVDNEPEIAAVIGAERTLGGLAVRIGGHILAPGVIAAEGVAQIVWGHWPNARQTSNRWHQLLQQLTDACNSAGIPTRISDDIQRELWKKLIINNGVNPLSALTGLDTRSLTHHPEHGPVVYAMMTETLQAARADGVELSTADLDEMHELIRSFNAIKTSMLVDREKGRPLELDSIAGAVLRRCKQQQLAAPHTERVMRALQAEYPYQHNG